MCADGFKLDKFVITTDPDFRPDTYIEPPASPAPPTVDETQVSRIGLSWNRVPRAVGYRLYYRNVTAGEDWSWGKQVELDSNTMSYTFAKVDGDSLHANTTYEFHVAAMGAQGDSHNNSNPPGTVSATTLAGGNGGYQGFESADLAGYPIPRDGEYMNQGYLWTYTRCSSEWSSLGELQETYDRGIVTYGTSSSIVSEPIPGGFGSLSFTVARHGWPSGARYAVLVNGTEVGRTHKIDKTTYEHFAYNFPGVNVTGDVVISIVNLTPDDGNNSRGSIDDIRWTGYAGGAPDTPTDVASAFSDSGLTIQWSPVAGATGYRVFREGAYPEQYVVAATSATNSAYMGDKPIGGLYTLRVTALNARGESPWSDSTVILPMKCGPMRNGLHAYYYDGTALFGDAYEKVDSTVNFDSFDEEPAPGLGTTGFSVVWVGQVEPEFSETYTFSVNFDDGVRLWVDGRQLVDQWDTRGEEDGSIELEAGQKYHILMQYQQKHGGGRAQLSWSSPSVTKQIIPSSRLWTGPECTPGVEISRPRLLLPEITAPYVRQHHHGFTFGVPARRSYRLTLYDMAGRVVATHRGHGEANYVSTRTMPNGLYVIRLQSGAECITTRLMIRR